MKISSQIRDFLFGFLIAGFLSLTAEIFDSFIEYIIDLFKLNSDTVFMFIIIYLTVFSISALSYVVEYKKYFVLIGFIITLFFGFLCNWNC